MPPRSEQEKWLRQLVAGLCHLEHERYLSFLCPGSGSADVLMSRSLHCRFPGSQPVSFGGKDMEKLESQEYVLSLV